MRAMLRLCLGKLSRPWPARSVSHVLPPLLLALACGWARADVIVLTSDDKGAVAAATRALQAAYTGRVELHNLSGSRTREPAVVKSINESAVTHVVAVGLLAAQVARQQLDGKKVVFCQVLNFEEFGLVTPWMKGVSGIPSLPRQFSAWKALDPNRASAVRARLR